MKGGGKKKTTTLEPPNDVAPPPPGSSGLVAVTASVSVPVPVPVPVPAGDDAVAAVDFGVDAAEHGNGGHGDGAVGIGVGGDPVGPVAENENAQLQKGEEEGAEPRVEDSEEEEAPEEEEDEEGEDEEMEDADAEAVAPEQGKGRPLADGFYEVEAIRRKRIRKGETHYLIKWLGWPETANTWEPPENLENVPEIVAAFEESWNTAKHRKRRRKHVVHHTALKKRLERSITPYSLRRFAATSVINNNNSNNNNHTQSAPPPPPLTGLNYADIPAFPQPVIFADEVENNGDAGNVGRAKHRLANTSEQIVEANEENDYDPKLSELRASTANGYDADRLAIQFQETNLSSGDGHMDGQANGVGMESGQSGRCRGAKRRKSGSVKRFNKDLSTGEPVNTQNPIGMSDPTAEPGGTGIADNGGNHSYKKTDHAKPASTIAKIIKPVNCSPAVPSSTEDVVVTFLAMRSDGAEVMVDNQYLKTYHPLLLINFYEQHLRYSPTS